MSIKVWAVALAAVLGVTLTSASPGSALVPKRDGYEEVHEGRPPVGDQTCGTDELRHIVRDWANACFYSYGDVFWIADSEPDGYSVAIQWRVYHGKRIGLIRNKLGSGHQGYLNKDLPEGKLLKWRVGRCNVSSTRDCRRPADYVDWGTGTSAEAFCISINQDEYARFCDW